MGQTMIRYSEAFKRQVVDEIDRGKFSSINQARKAYRINGNGTVEDWLRKYGREELLPKIIRIETVKERNELKELRKRVNKLETALADAHIDCSLGDAFLEIACERMGTSVEDFKKKNELTLSDVRKMRCRQ
jgi:transposase-like protein